MPLAMLLQATQIEPLPEEAAATATLVIGTHEASEADLSATVVCLEQSDVVSSVTSVLRVEGL